MMQPQLLSALSYLIRSKVKRLIKQGEQDDSVILSRIMDSVTKEQVRAMAKGMDLDTSVIELRAKEIIKDELRKANNKRVKQNTNPDSPLNEYTKLKVALLSGRRNMTDFRRDTFAQLRIEAAHNKELHGDKACEVLMGEITSNAPYMEILRIAHISEHDLRNEINKALGSESAEKVELDAMRQVDGKGFQLLQKVRTWFGKT